MPTKTTPSPVPPHHHSEMHYTQLAKISAGLFIGVLALMTFLLTAGLQHPQKVFTWFMYISLIALPLNLLAYTLANSIQEMSTPPKPKEVGSWTALRAMRLAQQIIFIISIAAVTGLALSSAHIFFAAPTASSSAQSSTQAQ